jgi:hypothetical protein
MWGGLAALTDNLKEFTGKQPTDAGPAQPALPRDRSKPDLWEEKYGVEAPPPQLPAIEQQTSKENENPPIPEQSQEESFKRSAPVEQRQSSTVGRKPPDSARPAPEKRSPPEAARRNGNLVTDRELEMQVEKAIDNRALRGIDVSVKDGTAYLRGRVPTTRQRLAATRAAQSVPGVNSVENQISLD